MQLTKENLQDFIANYAISFNPLTDNSWQQAYNQGSATVSRVIPLTSIQW